MGNKMAAVTNNVIAPHVGRCIPVARAIRSRHLKCRRLEVSPFECHQSKCSHNSYIINNNLGGQSRVCINRQNAISGGIYLFDLEQAEESIRRLHSFSIRFGSLRFDANQKNIKMMMKERDTETVEQR
jgi:hypothetical protein